MTYADQLGILNADFKLKQAVVRQFEAVGFGDAGEIIDYIIADYHYELAKAEYFQYFSRCVRMDINLDTEI
jgi:hypothetical protein